MQSGAAAATSSGLAVENVERQKAEPAAAAARARPSSPSGCAIRWYATGATTTGEPTGWPSTVVAVETASIPQRTRWRRRHEPNAATLRRASAPRPRRRRGTRTSAGSIRATARASTSVSVSGVSTAAGYSAAGRRPHQRTRPDARSEAWCPTRADRGTKSFRFDPYTRSHDRPATTPSGALRVRRLPARARRRSSAPPSRAATRSR